MSNSQHLLIPEQGAGKCQIPLRILLFLNSPSLSGLCYRVHGSRIAGYGGDAQSLDLRKDKMFVGSGLKGTVDVSGWHCSMLLAVFSGG